MRGVLISSNLKGREFFFPLDLGSSVIRQKKKKFMSLQRTCDLDFLCANLIPISKSHTIHLMDYM